MSSQSRRDECKQLLDMYGALLTTKQAEFARSFFIDGKSFSQIARDHNISRQAVHEAVHHVEKTLRFYNEKLQTCFNISAAENRNAARPPADVAAACERLDGLKTKILHRGIIYNVDFIVQEIDAVLDILESKEPITQS